MVRRISILLGLFFLSALPVLALGPDTLITQYVRESWTDRDGAPSGTITALAQTPDGYLWLGTEGEGLVRFDGVSFVRENGIDGLFGQSINRITSMICSRDGALWVGSYSGLARLKNGHWTAFDRGPGNVVFGLIEAPDGAVWYGRHWMGLFRVHDEQVTPLPLSGKPRFVTIDTRRVMWAGGYDGLWRLDGGNRRHYSKKDGLRDTTVNQVYADAKGNVWVGTCLGLTQLHDDRVTAHFTTRDGFLDHDIRAIYTDQDGILWVGTANGGLFRQSGNRFDALTKSMGLTSNHVTAIYEDREGSLWIGTSRGLNRLRNAALLPFGEAEGLSSQNTQAIAVERDGSVVVASGYAGINRMTHGQIRHIPPNALRGSDFDGALFANPDGSLWSGHLNGLSCRQGNGGSVFPVRGAIACISHDSQSIVYATHRGEVFRLINGKSERLRLADGSVLGTSPFEFDYVWMMHYSTSGELWLATTRGTFAIKDGKIRRVWKGTLSTRSISEDKDGTFWLGTMDGIVRVTKDASTRLFTMAEGLPENDIYYVQSDRSGALWLSGSHGLARIQRRELEDVASGKAKRFSAEMFGAADGMRTSEATAIYQPSGCVTKDGRLWFSTTEGVVAVDPGRIRRNALPPPVLIEKINADDNQIDIKPEITVGAGTHRLAIHYNGLSLLVPLRVRFKYKLEGYDHEWIEAKGNRVAYYTKLPPGHYVFRVTAANNDGVWNDAGASIKIRKAPYFYQTIWFMVLAGLALMAGAVGLYRFRIRWHIRAERELQSRINEALSRINTLNGLIPVCAWCKKIRDDAGYWSQLEEYVSKHTQAEVSHGICPDCQGKLLDMPSPESK